VTLLEVLDFLRTAHKSAPFLFFNGNTFAGIGRQLADAVFKDLPYNRLREATSAIAHYVAGVLDRGSMIQIVESLCRAADLAPGDRVTTLRGSTRGVIVRVLEDGRIVWKPDGGSLEIVALPENLMLEKPGNQ
jgi:hypothetical protein